MKHSIRYKTLYYSLIICLLTFIFITLSIGRIIRNNNHTIIKNDVRSQTHSISIFINEYIKSNGISNLEESASELGTILSSKFNKRIILYSTTKDFLFDSIYKKGETPYFDDLEKDLDSALIANPSYSISRSKKVYWASVTAPIELNQKVGGAFRFFVDYSYLSDMTDNLYKYIEFSIVIMFILLFILILIYSNKIIKPIIKLNKATEKVAQGDFSSPVNIKTNDELQELAENFNIMKIKIKTQILELQKERDNLVNVQKYKKRFFDNITHELKTPLTIISGYSQILRNDKPKTADFINDRLLRIQNEADKMHNMILELLDISLAESEMEYNFKEFDLSKTLSNSIEDLSLKSAKKSISINSRIKNSVNLLGDELRLRQCITNLIDNAIKYSPENTQISISLDTSIDHCYLVVTDQGMGIPSEHIDNLFKPFFRIDKSSKDSSGLGLYIVKLIIDKHHGSINVRGNETQGTEITLKIPLNVYKTAKRS